MQKAMLERQTFVIDTTLDVRIELTNECTVIEEIRACRIEMRESYELHYFVSIFPAGFDEHTQNWLVVRPSVTVYEKEKGKVLESFDLKILISIIDIEGNSRIPRHLTSDEDNRNVKYLEKSFILERRDELLSEGALHLRCEIHHSCDLMRTIEFDVKKYIELCFLEIPQAICPNDNNESGTASGPFTVFDHSSLVLTLGKDYELRRAYGVYGIAPLKERKTESDSLSELGILRYIVDNVWIFDTCPDRFLLNLDPHPDNVGHLLVKASPVIKRCVETSMKEQQEQKIEFPIVDSLTFRIVLFFVKHEKLPLHIYDEIFEVYKFSHLYDIEPLRKECASFILERCQNKEAELELLKKAELFSDEYLKALLKSRESKFVTDDRLNSDCFN